MFISIHAEKHCTKPFCNNKEKGRVVQKGAGKLGVGEPQEKRLYTEVGEVLKRFRNVVGTG